MAVPAAIISLRDHSVTKSAYEFLATTRLSNRYNNRQSPSSLSLLKAHMQCLLIKRPVSNERLTDPQI